MGMRLNEIDKFKVELSFDALKKIRVGVTLKLRRERHPKKIYVYNKDKKRKGDIGCSQ